MFHSYTVNLINNIAFISCSHLILQFPKYLRQSVFSVERSTEQKVKMLLFLKCTQKCKYSKESKHFLDISTTGKDIVFLFFYFFSFLYLLSFPINVSHFYLQKFGPLRINIKTNKSHEILTLPCLTIHLSALSMPQWVRHCHRIIHVFSIHHDPVTK